MRRIVLEAALAAGSCHIGSSLSIVDIVTVLYFRHAARRAGDRFLLSKGHAAAALYAVLARTGTLDEREVVARLLQRRRLAARPSRSGTSRASSSPPARSATASLSPSATRSPTAPTAATAAPTASSATASSTRARSGRPSRWPAIWRPRGCA